MYPLWQVLPNNGASPPLLAPCPEVAYIQTTTQTLPLMLRPHLDRTLSRPKLTPNLLIWSYRRPTSRLGPPLHQTLTPP